MLPLPLPDASLLLLLLRPPLPYALPPLSLPVQLQPLPDVAAQRVLPPDAAPPPLPSHASIPPSHDDLTAEVDASDRAAVEASVAAPLVGVEHVAAFDASVSVSEIVIHWQQLMMMVE